jgi:isopentenyldiphosphate isomerase
LDQGLIEHEFDHVFVAEFLGKGGGDGYIPSFNPQEIATMEWIDLEALINQLENPQNSEKRYAPWLKEVALKTLNFAKQVSDS